jgi:hypothetical protein
MRATIIVLALAIAVGAIPAHLFAAGGDYRSKVDQKYKHILQSERQSDIRLKGVEREAAPAIGSVDSPTVSKTCSGRKAK